MSDINQGGYIKGDFTVYTSGSADLGYGDLKVDRNAYVLGTSDSTGTSDGSLMVSGGLGLGKKLYVGGSSFLQATDINTTNGIAYVHGANAFNVAVQASSSIATSVGSMTIESSGTDLFLNGSSSITANCSTGGILLDGNGNSHFNVTGAYDLTMESTLGRTILTSGKNQPDAIQLNSTNAAGGITFLAGTNGLTATMSGGPINMTSQYVASSWTQATNDAGQHLTFQLTGATSSRMIFSSSGTTSNAITMSSLSGGMEIDCVTGFASTVSAGGISLNSTGGASNFTNNCTADSQDLVFQLSGTYDSSIKVLSSGTSLDAILLTASATTSGIQMNSGTSGFDLNTTGPLTMDCQGGNSHIKLTSTGAGQILALEVIGTYDSKVLIQSAGTSSTAIQLNATNATSGITGACGSGGFTMISTGGKFDIQGGSMACNIAQSTTSSDQDFTITQTGAFTSRIVISSESTSNDAIKLNASGGGIDIEATKKITINTSDTTNGIDIGNTSNVPIFIGSSLGMTTIRHNLTVVGNLTVSGTTTTVDSVTLTIADNIMLLNSAPLGSHDAGILVKRWQGWNDSSAGDLIGDPLAFTFTALSGTSTTIVLPTTASSANSYYNGMWVHIKSGTGVGQVRRIKSYVGLTRTATIYSTADETSSPSIPEVGHDFTTNADVDSVVDIFYTDYCGMIYQEASDYIILAYAALDPSTGSNMSVTRYAKLRCNSIDSDGTLTIDNINEHTTNNGVTIESVNVKDGALTNVTTINGATVSADYEIQLVDNASTAVSLPGSFSWGVYNVLVGNKTNHSGAFAHFSLSGNSTLGFTINRISSVASTTKEQLDINASAGSAPTISHKPTKVGGTGALITYVVKITKVI